MNPLDVILIALAALITAYVLVVIVLRATRQARRAGEYMRDTVTAPFSSHAAETDRDRRYRELEDDVRRALGIDDTPDAQVRADIVQAARTAQFIGTLHQQLRQSVTRCLGTHWSVAQGLGAVDMGEAARHPWSQRSRQRVIDQSELLSQHLERYPLIFEAPELMRLQLGLRWLPATCVSCPYFAIPVSAAPRICPTAKAFGHGRSGAPRSGVIDGVVDDCDGGPR